ncbi:Ribosomal RNA small subunit methyltransferase A [Buchnera aphidicola (Cinara kochiana kochiana)]|uniref:Ribosomal RNA small subunit methyltransferase A n=1 Tax=Buchnera aphidicola (Cinara kochiana kochiana) TaxID=2518976 RepID=A0A451D5N4_9GAMM|nr:16S rRNA (adenine(1518)-N(6)/adenine(1519)-N(6))-dimethyltransferase RsmA [Buchnera aphidicola]VFP81014.1 Ribosomal RNA small subunit methyltransferase A [Buchnera aphidicola (Cinara kochiana kochiana)]
MNGLIYKKHIPVKRFGQNFLKNKIIINKILQQMYLKNIDNFIEIGPGLGALTFPICNVVNKITVLEIDENIVFFLLQSKYNKKMQIILTDVMKFDFQYFFSLHENILYRLVGNLPYSISTCLLINLIQYNSYILDMNFMFQKEVACRLLAIPGSKEYGKISILAQYFYKIIPICDIDKCNFFPSPKIDSVFLRFIPYRIHNQKQINRYFFALELITRIAFQHRRKFLNKNISKLFSQQTLLKCDIHPFSRAEDVSVYQYYLLAKNFLKLYF